MIMNPLGKLFGRSPFAALQQHMAKAHECAAEAIPFFDAVLAEEWDAALAIQQRIQQLEEQADVTKRATRSNLPGGLLMLPEDTPEAVTLDAGREGKFSIKP